MGERIAVFSDVHGNTTALEAVYQDSIKQKVDKYWFLGDLFSPGPGAQDLWDLFKQINPEICIRGNWDDLFLNALRGVVDTDRTSLVYISKLAQTLSERLDANEVTSTIKKWPIREETRVRDIRVGLTHNLPDLNYGQALYPTEKQRNFNELFDGNQNLDLAIYAHVHHPLMRYSSDEQFVLNPGSVGQPFFAWDKFQKDMRAEYLILEIDEHGIQETNFRKVYYDRDLEYKRAELANLPYLDIYKLQLVTGKVHIHDHELMKKINDERGYLNDVIKFNEKVRKKG